MKKMGYASGKSARVGLRYRTNPKHVKAARGIKKSSKHGKRH